MHLISLTPYTKEDGLASVLYLKSEDGLDWYENQDLFTKQYKISVDQNSKIVAYTEDISGLWPINCSVYETDTIPSDIDKNSYKFINGIFVLNVDYETKARDLRNLLRTKIDKYLLPASTIGDILVTEEQKQTLIQDSLLLASWPVTEGWPYINLPALSDLCQSLITIPLWDYPNLTSTTEE